MPKRTLIIIAAIVLLLILGGGYFLFKGNKTANPNEAQISEASTAPAAQENVFTSIKDALSKSVSLECSYDTGGSKVTSYIKNGAVRTNIAAANAQESGSIIIKDKKMYFWNGKTGFMMELPDINDLEKIASNAADKNASTGKDMIDNLEKYKDSCKPGVVPDDLFVPPSDVKFTDFSKMMPKAGASGVPVIDQSQIQKLMDQYSKPSE